MKVLSGIKKNAGYQRNRCLQEAQGKYIYFFDSDDRIEPNTFEEAIDYAETLNLDVVYFEGDTFYESGTLAKQFSVYDNAYQRNHAYPAVYEGRDLFCRLTEKFEFSVQPCMRLARRDFLLENKVQFTEIRTLDDNLPALETILAAKRCGVLPKTFFHRRIRESSLMTTAQNFQGKTVLETRTVVMLGVCRLLMQWRQDESVVENLLRFSKPVYDEFQNAMQETEKPDFSFLNGQFTAEEMMEALLGWNRFSGADGELYLIKRSKAYRLSLKIRELWLKVKKNKAFRLWEPKLKRIRQKIQGHKR